MSLTIFSTSGCKRCKMIKSYMDQHEISYEDVDIKAEGKDRFKDFYQQNRKQILRGDDGIEFPILFTGERIIQGLSTGLAYLKVDDQLEGFIKRNELSHDWIGGFSLTAGEMPSSDDFLEIVRYVKQCGLKIQLEADGHHPDLLKTIIAEKGVDRLHFILRGPAAMYAAITGVELSDETLSESLALLKGDFEYRILLPIAPIQRENGQFEFLTPEEASAAAQLVENATGSKKHPFIITLVTPEPETGLEPLPASAYFKYRTACRRFMVMAEIQK